jgi:hypothetical protein
MKYRKKSTIYYAASMAGVPLALDMNFLRNFAYVRVKIGCEDPTLVPSSRIGAIKKGFYEFQFTREFIDPASNPANYYVAAVENSDGGAQQNSPKRQRTGREEEGHHVNINGGAGNNNLGGGNSQVNQQRDNNAVDGKGKYVVVSSTSISDDLSESFATKVQRAMGHTTPAVGGNSESSSAAAERIAGITNQVDIQYMQEVHRDVVTALAQEVVAGSFDTPVMDNSESFRKFLGTLARNGSDKGFMHQKSIRN